MATETQATSIKKSFGKAIRHRSRPSAGRSVDYWLDIELQCGCSHNIHQRDPVSSAPSVFSANYAIIGTVDGTHWEFIALRDGLKEAERLRRAVDANHSYIDIIRIEDSDENAETPVDGERPRLKLIGDERGAAAVPNQVANWVLTAISPESWENGGAALTWLTERLDSTFERGSDEAAALLLAGIVSVQGRWEAERQRVAVAQTVRDLMRP